MSRIPKWLRWILLIPVSLFAGFVVSGLIGLVAENKTGGVMAYSAAFLSGVGYVWAALSIAHFVAPSRKSAAATVLGLLILGDLSFIHFVLPEDFLQSAAADGGVDLILQLLRADEYQGLQNSGMAKVGGSVVGFVLAQWLFRRSTEGQTG